MEGEGEVVAMVQGLRDAGLAVTLLARGHPRRATADLARLLGAPPPSQACQTVTDTSTETVAKGSIGSDLYRSTYQMAHCHPSGSLPVPQYSFQGFQQFRGSTTRTPDEEAFVESLRKYPISPVRSRSADLIERMLSYAQFKNGARYSNTRSAKSLPAKKATKDLPSDEIPTRDTCMTTTDLTPNFGYKRDVELLPVPTSNRKSRCDSQIGMYDYLKSNHKEKKLKGSEVRYLTNVKQCLRERLRQICDEEPRTICPKIQNRYSQHRRQYHRAETSQKTQKVNYCKKPDQCPQCKENSTQASSQNEIQMLPNTLREHKVDRSLSSFKNSKACFCDRPGSCNCGSKQSRSIMKPKLFSKQPVSETNKRKQCTSISICDHECTEDVHMNKLRDIVLKWCQELPVYANLCTSDAIKRQEIIDGLIESLRHFQKDNTYFEKVETEIKKCLKVLPIWRPDNKEDQESFENQLAQTLLQRMKSLKREKDLVKVEISRWIDSISFTRDNIDKEKLVNELVDKLRPITLKQPYRDKEALKSEIVSMLNELPISFNGSKTSIINNIADKLVENLNSIVFEQSSSSKQLDIKNIVLHWIKNIPDIFEDININNDDYVLVNNLITRLENLQSKDAKEEQMNDEISNWFQSVEEKKKCQIDLKMKNMLTRLLLGKLFDLYEGHRRRENLNGIIQKWFDDILDTLGVSFIDNQKYLDILTITLQELQKIQNDENRLNTMRQEILKWLQNLQKRCGRYVDTGIQENLVNKLINMIKDESNVQKNEEIGLITHNIWKWLESQPEFKQDNSMQYRDMAIELSQKLLDIKDFKGELTENEVKAEVTKWFEKLSQERGIQIHPYKQKNLQEKLLSSISPIKRRKYWEKPNSLQELISSEISSIINNSILPLQENDLERLKNQITQVITQNWNAINSNQTNESLAKVINILKEISNLSETQVDSLAQKLINKVKEVNLSNLGDIVPEGPIILDNTSKGKFKKRVENILKLLPLKNKHEVIDKITNTLVKNYEEARIDTGFEVIYEVLTKANINDLEAQEATNNLLDMSNQFKNAMTDTTYNSPSYGSAESLWVQKQMFMQRLEQEITDFMEKVLNESSSFYKEKTAIDLTNSEPLESSTNQYHKFKNTSFKTSTPVKSQNGRDMSIESQYRNQIKERIKIWINCLEIANIIDESFKDEMAHDIATDIIDRQRYIQVSNTKRSSGEEVEHLKYQVFKWTSKMPNLNDLTTKASQIKMLIKSLQNIGMLDLSQDPNREDDSFESGNILNQDTFEFMHENIYGALWEWFYNVPTLKPRSSEERCIMNDLIIELSENLKKILSLDPNTQVSNIENLCIDEIVNCLRKLKRHQKTSEELLQDTANELMNHLKCIEFFAGILKRNQDVSSEAANMFRKKDAIKKAVQTWCQKLPLKSGKTYDGIRHIVNNLAEAVSQYLLITDMENLNTFMDDILDNLRKLPLQFDKEDTQHLPEFTERLIEKLKDILNDSEKYYNIQDDSVLRKPALKKAIEVMYNNIQHWCENLPLDLGITNKGIEEVIMLKQNIAGLLIKKIGELNLDPEIFHDDYIYEDILKDKIENILNSFPKSKQLEETLPTLMKNLIKDLLDAKEALKNELAGFAYKRQLRDAISKTLSSIGLPVSEETQFEILKDNLADAFISLHYIANDEELKRKFKDKIFNEVNKFCDNYLKHNPSIPLNAHKLNQELYNALKNVPVPKDESMRREVEQIRIKDIVNDWFKGLPLEETQSHIQENKIISILAKRLHEIENEAELNPNIDVDEAMSNEILKWLKKLKLKFEIDPSAEPVTKKLINELKTTKHDRKFNESTTRKSINYTDLPHFPPSNLSLDDKAHLERIKERTATTGIILESNVKKDVLISPVPTATGMQTEEKQIPDIFQKISQNASIQTIIRDPEQPSPITPQVIVKEYYWDSHGSPTTQRSGSLLSCMQYPMAHQTGSIHQQANITSQESPHVTQASQTMALPESKATITQEASIEQVIKTRIQKASIGTEPQSFCLAKATGTEQELSIKSQEGHYNPDDYLQLNLNKERVIKSCQPCRERAVLSEKYDSNLEAGTSRAIQHTKQIGPNENEPSDPQRKPDFWSTGHINGDNNYLECDDNLNQPCFRRPIYQTPTKDVECLSKRKRRSQPPCTCRTCKTSLLSKCTIPPQPPCQHLSRSNKSCYVSRKHCPKCWDGFCPHPSYLYFRQD